MQISGSKKESRLTPSYKAVVLPILLYACETLTVYRRDEKTLNHILLSCLKKKTVIIKLQDKIADKEVLKQAGIHSMHTVLKTEQLRWTGHIIRMPDERLPKKCSNMDNYRRESAL